MSNFTRKVRRNNLKEVLLTNKIRDAYHYKYGSTPNEDKTKIKVLERLKRKLRKLAHKKARMNRKEK